MNIKKYLFKNKIGLFGIVFTSLLISISEVFIALLMKRSLDLIINRRFSELLYIIIYFFLILTLSVIGYYYNGLISAYYKKNVLSSIRYDLSNQIMEMNIPAFEHYESGYILSALTTDINQLETKYLDVLLKIIRQSSSFLLSSITMLYFSIPLTITLYLFIIFLIIAPKKTYKKMQELGLKFSENSSINSTKIREILDGFETIKAFRATQKFNDQLNFLNNNCEKTRYLIGKKESSILSILSGISLLTFFIPFFIGLVFISKGLIQPGVLMALINLSGSIINPIQQFGSNMANIKIGEGIFKNLLDTIINSNKSNLNTVCCKNHYIDMLNVITIQNLCFSYSNNLIFSNLSLVFENKKKYLITGTSGCGKSTLLKLLLGFYDNYQGSIKFNNIEITDISNDNFPKIVSYIPQKTFILNGSIKENIIFNSTYDSEKLINVCTSAALNETIESLPNGLDTIIGDGGRQLSGGQLQRISIARALYSNASMLLVDEATSSLDDENSYNINNILLNLDKLVIHVCHKISDNQSKQYDEIISIDDLIYPLK